MIINYENMLQADDNALLPVKVKKKITLNFRNFFDTAINLRVLTSRNILIYCSNSLSLSLFFFFFIKRPLLKSVNLLIGTYLVVRLSKLLLFLFISFSDFIVLS